MNLAFREKIRINHFSIFVAHVIISVALALYSLLYFVGFWMPEELVYITSVVSVFLSSWVIMSWKRVSGSLFDPYIIFMYAAILFNNGQTFLEMFGFNENGLLLNRFSVETIIQTMLFVILSLAAFHLGALWSMVFGKQTNFEIRLLTTSDQIKAVRTVGWLFIAISLVPAAIRFLSAIEVVLSSGYLALYQQNVSAGLDATPRALATFLIPATLFLCAGAQDRKFTKIVSVLTVVTYCVIEFFLGARSAAVMPLIAFSWLWHNTIRRLPGFALIGLGIVLLFGIFPLVKLTRGMTGDERLAISIADLFLSADNPGLLVISEMGKTMSTIAYTIDLVPSMRDFDLGIGYFYALLTGIPNLFWDIHPSMARGKAGHWLVDTIAPDVAARGGGYGYSFIAEAYLNFGWLGSLIVLCLMGYILGRFTRWTYQSCQLEKFALAATVLSFLPFFARAEAADLVRSILWYALIPYGIFLLIKNKTQEL